METENDVSETTRPRRRLDYRKLIVVWLLLVVLFVAIQMFWNRSKMEGKLQEALSELDRSDPGWRLEEIEAARDQMPDEENSAHVLIEATHHLSQPWPPPGFPSEPFHIVPPNELLDESDFDRLSRGLERVKSVLAMAGKVADMPRGRYRLQFGTNPIATPVIDQYQSLHIVNMLVFDSMSWNHSGKSKKALTACRAALNAARSLGDEPMLRTQMLRSELVVLVCEAIERTLGQGELSAQELRDLQKLLENEDAFPGLLIAMRGSRAILDKAIEGVERGVLTLDDLLPKGTDWFERASLGLSFMDTREDHALMLSMMTRRVEEAQRPMQEQAVLENRFEEEVHHLPETAILSRTLLPAVFQAGESFRRKHAMLRCAIASLAAERYRRDKRAWPENADQLCPQYLSAVLLDPYDGKPLRYRRVKDGAVIYSVGQDVVDDGGNLNRDQRKTSSVDIGFRLWDVAKRRQPARPKRI
jgi:hypothetical protein